jgi:translation initiation factor IF-1
MFVRAKPAGKLRKHNIKIIVGDKVKVELNEYDPTQ